MGSGKTIICLAVIVATMNQPCQPPSDRPVSPVYPTYGLHHIPFERERQANINPDATPLYLLPTLAQLAAAVVLRSYLSLAKTLI